MPIALLVAKWLFLGQFAELFLWLPLLPARLIFANDEEIRRMKVCCLAPRGCLIAQLKGRRLIVELLHLFVVVHQVDSTQFDGMTLELDGNTHLA